MLLLAVVGAQAAAWLSSRQWLGGGLRYQYLPVEPLLAAIGVLTWMVWAYAALVTGLRLLAVVATRRGISGSTRLLSYSNLVTVGPLRSLIDAAVGVSLFTAAQCRDAANGAGRPTGGGAHHRCADDEGLRP
jgi:phage tail tape-measure protein